jgi:hypothetical protein
MAAVFEIRFFRRRRTRIAGLLIPTGRFVHGSLRMGRKIRPLAAAVLDA